MEMDWGTKFQETTKAVKSVNLDLNIAKMAYNDEVNKGEQDNIPQKAVQAGKAAPDKLKKPKKTEGDESPQAAVIEAMAALDGA